ncbi:MAG: hypothetical protein AAF733_11675 [Verrucomicrobiota bacterium]
MAGHSFSVLRLLGATSAFIFLSVLLSGCQSTGGDAGPYEGASPVTTADRAAFMQERIGQIQRSAIR